MKNCKWVKRVWGLYTSYNDGLVWPIEDDDVGTSTGFLAYGNRADATIAAEDQNRRFPHLKCVPVRIA